MALIELEVLPGLKPIAQAELLRQFPDRIRLLKDLSETGIRFEFAGNPADLHSLRTVVAAYILLPFDIPRPKALLGHEHFTRLTGQLDRVRGMHPSGSFSTFRFSAAGKDSSVFNRLRDELTNYTHLENTPDDANLYIRVRPSKVNNTGWDVLIRTTPLPLSTRAYRVINMEGALNATIAAAMVELTNPQPQDAFFNMMCGTGTLLIERMLRGPVDAIAGCDSDPGVLEIAGVNIKAAGFTEDDIPLLLMDATQTDLPDAAVDVIVIDPPWGHLVGSADMTAELYPAMLREAARIAAKDARLVVISHAIESFERTADEVSTLWELQDTFRVLQGGLHPRIYCFRRR